MQRAALASTRLALAELFLRQRNYNDAAPLLADLTKAPPAWSNYPEAALLAGRALNMFRDDTRLTQSERRQRADLARGQVIALLRRAEQQHTVLEPAVLDNPAFATLAEDSDFKDLRNSLEQRRAGQQR